MKSANANIWIRRVALPVMVAFSLNASLAQSPEQIAFGKQIFREKANCGYCHGWAGDGNGDPHAGGGAANLRETVLDHDQLTEVIGCGRPASNMPHFNQFAWSEDKCYGMLEADVGKDIPGPPPASLQPREIEAIIAYLQAKVMHRGPITKAECIEFFRSGTGCDPYP